MVCLSLPDTSAQRRCTNGYSGTGLPAKRLGACRERHPGHSHTDPDTVSARHDGKG